MPEFAIDVFSHRVAGAVGSMAVAAGGIDAVVFTGGIGERSAGARLAISRRLAVLGVEIDPALNDAADGRRRRRRAGVAGPRARRHRAARSSIAARAARDVVRA